MLCLLASAGCLARLDKQYLDGYGIVATIPSRHSIKNFLCIVQSRLWPWLATAPGWLFVFYLSATMLIKYDTDTTNISGAVFVALSILAGLAFTYAGVLPNESQDRAKVIYAGERVCQGALIFMGASLLKYGIVVMPTQITAISIWSKVPIADGIHLGPLMLFLRISLFVMFVSGILVAQLGYTIFGRVVVQRTSRFRMAVGYFPPDE